MKDGKKGSRAKTRKHARGPRFHANDRTKRQSWDNDLTRQSRLNESFTLAYVWAAMSVKGQQESNWTSKKELRTEFSDE
jgi:hypothetical protein